jgi:hypothetical protein
MKWAFAIHQKEKVALLLGCILLVIILSTILERSNMSDINESFTSIYEDRLIPATEIFYLTENLYSKRLLMEKFLSSHEDNQPEELQQNINMHNQNIDSLIVEYEKTYLVDSESKWLTSFKNTVSDYAQLEQSVMKLNKNGSRAIGLKIFENQGEALFQKTIQNLYQLTQIQSKVGKELIADSQSAMASTNILFNLQIALALIICVIIQILLLTSKVIKQQKQPFHLN